MAALIAREEARRLYQEEGLPGPEVGRRLGFTAKTVYNALDALGVERHARTFWPPAGGRPREGVVQRFVSRMPEGDRLGCLEWTGPRDKNGYGIFWLNGRSYRASQVAWRLFVGEVPPGLVVHHECWNRACVNPFHLNLLTPVENVSKAARRPYGRRVP